MLRLSVALVSLAVAAAGPVAGQSLTLGTEELLSASAGYPYNQRPRVVFTDDGTAHVAWIRGGMFWQEGAFVMRSVGGGGNYGAPVMISQGLDGVRYGPGDGLTLSKNGSNLVCSWEGIDFENRPVWFSRSTDAGLTWEAAAQADPGTVVERAYACGAPFADGRVTEVWMVYEAGTGIPDLRWSAQDGQGAFGAPTYPAEFAPQQPCECCNPDQVVLDDGTVLVAFRNNQNNQRRIFVSRSTDGGATWPTSTRLDTSTALFFICPSEAPSIAAEGQDVLVVWAKSPGFPPMAHVWAAVSTDGGQTFTGEIPVDDSDGSTFTRTPEVVRRGDFAVAVWLGADPVTTHDEIWAATSVNGGRDWGVPQMITGDGIDMVNAHPSVAISPITLEVEIVWRDNRDGTEKIYRIGGALDATSVDPVVAKPLRLTAAPNPFVTRTKLHFELPRPTDARLLIHDVAGRRVTEVSRTFPAGGSEIVWDGRDASGSPVGTGVYFVRLESPGGAEQLRVVRVR